MVTQADEEYKKQASATIVAIQDAGEKYCQEHRIFRNSQKSSLIWEFWKIKTIHPRRLAEKIVSYEDQMPLPARSTYHQ